MKALEHMEFILDNYYNGNLSDVVKEITVYGETFLEDLDFYLIGNVFLLSEQDRIFKGIAKLYFKRTFK